MAITWKSTTPMFSNPASQTKDGSTYTQNYQVKYDITGRDVDDINAGKDVQILEALAINAQGIPRFGNTFRGNRSAFLDSKSASVIAGQSNNIPSSVIVSCVYTTISVDKKDEEENPLQKAPDITWSTQFQREAIYNARILKVYQGAGNPVFTDQKGGRGGKIQQINNFVIPIVNSAGQSFNPFPEVDVPYMQCTVVENKPSFDAKQALEQIQTVNASDFRIDGYKIKKGQALLLNREAVIKYQGKLSYRQVTTSLLFKENHELTLLDQGTKIFGILSDKYNGGDPETRLIIDTDGQNNTKEEKLDGKGNILGKNEKPVFLNFGIYAVSDFNRLSLPRRRL